MRSPSVHLALSLGGALLVVAACMPLPSTSPFTADKAVALVLAEDARFTGIEPRDPDLIGQASWTEVTETEGGWRVVVRIGWGDCPAGCISEHRWTYTVSTDGALTLVEEAGDPLPSGAAVRGTVTAGPTCPVVTDPPDPACADRPVGGAVLVVYGANGAEVDRVTSDADGGFALELVPGSYRLVPQPVEGLMGTAEAVEFTVEYGAVQELSVVYDTGIR